MPYEFNPFTEEFDFYLYEPTEYVARKEEEAYSESWNAETDLPLARHGCAAAANSNYIFCAGGRAADCSVTNRFYIYSFSSGTWTNHSNLPYSAYGMIGLLDASGNFHVLGGLNGGFRNEHYIWDGSSWSSGPSLTVARYSPGGACDANGNIFISHGKNSSGWLASCEVLTAGSTAFSSKASASAVRALLGAAMRDENVYTVCCGEGPSHSNERSIEEYNLASDTWTDKTPSSGRPVARRGVLCFSDCNGNVHILGGKTTSAVTTHEIWDGTNCIAAPTSLPSPARYEMAQGGQGSGQGVCVGGYDGSKPIADVDVITFSCSTTAECYPIEEKC